MKQKKHNTHNKKVEQDKILTIKRFLLAHAQEIEDEATSLHKTYLASKKLRDAFLEKFTGQHLRVVRKVADQLDTKNIEKASEEVRVLGKQLAEAALKKGLSIEESVNGSVFFKTSGLEKIRRSRNSKRANSRRNIYDIAKNWYIH